MKANETQIGGQHYKSSIQHWDFVAANKIPYLEAMIIKYLTRWRKKNGVEDLYKAKHFMQKLFETENVDFESNDYEGEKPSRNYIDPDNNHSIVRNTKGMIPYPPIEALEKASFEDLIRWYALCPTPGVDINGKIGSNVKHMNESKIMKEIVSKLSSYNNRTVSAAIEKMYREQDAYNYG